MSLMIKLAERGMLNDPLIRKGIRNLLRERLDTISKEAKPTEQWIDELEKCPLAEHTKEANEQHYEVPAPYFLAALGPNLKYSSGFWESPQSRLESAEASMLKQTCERAELQSGQRILELGCGWGSLSLWMAKYYPDSQIVAISNSNSQRAYIEQTAQKRGLTNLQVITCDINAFEPEGQFDRVVSVEMFEHVRNHRKLLKKIYNWMNPGGKLFVHIFAHKSFAYLFEAKSSKDWMSKYFFTGGIMPSADLLPIAGEQLEEEARWPVNGTHYSKTLEAWLENHDANKKEVMRIFSKSYGSKNAKLWHQRWRIFYMACSELFGFNDGKEWMVMHYRFIKPTI